MFLQKAREKFRRLLSDSTTRLNALYKKLGKCVGKARPYFELLKKSKEVYIFYPLRYKNYDIPNICFSEVSVSSEII